jgi:hypothetical protein
MFKVLLGSAVAYVNYAESLNVVGSRRDEVNDLGNLSIIPAAIRPGVYSASNRNEYQKQKNNVSGE